MSRGHSRKSAGTFEAAVETIGIGSGSTATLRQEYRALLDKLDAVLNNVADVTEFPTKQQPMITALLCFLKRSRPARFATWLHGMVDGIRRAIGRRSVFWGSLRTCRHSGRHCPEQEFEALIDQVISATVNASVDGAFRLDIAPRFTVEILPTPDGTGKQEVLQGPTGPVRRRLVQVPPAPESAQRNARRRALVPGQAQEDCGWRAGCNAAVR